MPLCSTGRRSTLLAVGFLLVESVVCNAQDTGHFTIPVGAAESVVVVVTEFEGRAIAAESGFVVSSRADRSTIYVNARPLILPMEPLPGKPEDRTAVALVGEGPNARRVPLNKAIEMANGATLYTGNKSDLPAPLPKSSDIVAKEGMPLLIIGCDIGFVRGQAGAEESEEPKIVAVQAKVDRVFRSPRTLEVCSVAETESLLNLRTGIVTTIDGKIVGLAVAEADDAWRENYMVNSRGIVQTDKMKVSEDPRRGMGNRRFEVKPPAEIERAGGPELKWLRGNFKISNGTAKVDFKLAIEDPFARLKRPRLLVSTKLRVDKDLDTEPPRRNSIPPLIDEAKVTVREGIWTDRVAGDLEVELIPAEKIDSSFGRAFSKPISKYGKYFTGTCTFPATQTLPFVAQCVVDDEEGRMTPLGVSACLKLYSELEFNGRPLLKNWIGMGPPTYAR